jgi:site-specific DNA-methyltransferase (cytosine-N4-specific)
MHLFDFDENQPAGSEGKGSSGARGEIILGHALDALRSIPSGTFQTAITSPPYWGLRDYGIPNQLGAEPTVDEFVESLVTIFEELRRTLKDDGTFWLNIGDSYTSGGRTWRQSDKKLPQRGMNYRPATPSGLKPKDLIGVPWRLAFALQANGWYVRSDIIWHKPNVLPESVKDRPSRSHEHIFLLTKNEKYFYDYEAAREPIHNGKNGKRRNRRDVWQINTEAFPEAHFATFPRALVIPCLQAGSRNNDTVLDPFLGSGTTGEVCLAMGRSFVGIELHEEYAEIAKKRIFRNCGVTVPIREAQP